jgi:hypothetical protein
MAHQLLPYRQPRTLPFSVVTAKRSYAPGWWTRFFTFTERAPRSRRSVDARRRLFSERIERPRRALQAELERCVASAPGPCQNRPMSFVHP